MSLDFALNTQFYVPKTTDDVLAPTGKMEYC